MSTSFHSLTVKEIISETEDAFSVVFEVPEELSNSFQYKAGQYLTLRFNIDGTEARRAYSMSSAPFEKDLKVTVKRVKGGLVSNYIADQVFVGSAVDVMPPQGRFTTKIKDDNRRTYYFFGAGSGITPLMSLIKTILEDEPQSTIFLLYGNRDEDCIIFKDELTQLSEKYAGQLIVEHTLSQPLKQRTGGITGFFKKAKMNWQGQIGRIDRKCITRFLDENPKRYDDTVYYICGPGGMIDTVEAALLGNGIPKDRINIERFVNEHDAKKSNNLPTSDGAAKKVTITLDGEIIRLTVPKGKTILDALIEEKYEPPYSCRAGSCSTCIGKVLNGKVEMEACYALDDDEIEEGYVLTCQSHPVTEEVEITYEV